MKYIRVSEWETTNVLIDDMDLLNLAENLSYDNLKKLSDAYIVKQNLYYFKDKRSIEDVIDFANYLYMKDEEDHSKGWYVTGINYLINEKNFTLDELMNMHKSELFDMIYEPELVEEKVVEQEPERER